MEVMEVMEGRILVALLAMLALLALLGLTQCPRRYHALRVSLCCQSSPDQDVFPPPSAPNLRGPLERLKWQRLTTHELDETG